MSQTSWINDNGYFTSLLLWQYALRWEPKMYTIAWFRFWSGISDKSKLILADAPSDIYKVSEFIKTFLMSSYNMVNTGLTSFLFIE